MKNYPIFLLLLLPFGLFAQNLELGLMAGVSNYQGDLAPSSVAVSVGQTHAAYGGFIRYNVNPFVSAKFNTYYGTISGDDAKSERPRNLSFRSDVLEFGLTGEFNILGYEPYNLQRVFTPYVFAGIAYYRFNPKALHNDTYVELQPLGTEGQGLDGQDPKYKLGQFSIPIGAGVKYAINDKWNIGLEFGTRKTFTDHLDDVGGHYYDNEALLAGNGELAAILANRSGSDIEAGTRRGNPDKLDWYFMGGLTISYNFADNGLVGSRNRGGRKTGCPTF